MHTPLRENLKIMIVDDEKPARDEMEFLLKSVPNVTISAVAGNGEEALFLAEKKRPDLLFLDIKMAEMNGFQVAEKLHEQGLFPGIIFTTAYDQYALKAFEISAVDYILKPVEEERLIESIEKYQLRNGSELRQNQGTIERLIRELSRQDNKTRYLAVCQGDAYIPIPFKEIILVSAKGRSVEIKTAEGLYNYGKSIGEMEELLNSGNFFRCHRSYIINLDQIKKIGLWFNNTYRINMNYHKETITVSRSYISRFREIMSIL